MDVRQLGVDRDRADADGRRRPWSRRWVRHRAASNQYTCINGVWMAPGTTGGGAGAASGATTAQGALPPPTPQCVGTPPVAGTGQTVACENGVWVIR